MEVKTKRYATAAIGNSNHDVVDECSIPQYNKPISFDMPPSNDAKIKAVLNTYSDIIITTFQLQGIQNSCSLQTRS